MRAYRETFRRHRVLYLLPALIAAVVVGALSYKAPTYMSSASLWVDNQASSGSSLNVTSGSSQGLNPSAAEQTMLNELLATKKFQNAVLVGAGLGHGAANSSLLAGVASGTPGPQVLQVTSVGPSPRVAHDIVESVITQLQSFSQQWARYYASSSVAYYQAQVQSATQAVQEAKTVSGSSQAADLSSAMSALTTASSALSQAQAQANGHNGFSTVLVLGQPTFNPAPMRGLKTLLTKALGAGAAVLLLSLLVIIIRTPGGHDEWDDEVSGTISMAAGARPVPATTDAAALGPEPSPVQGNGGAAFGTVPVAGSVTPPAPVSPPAPAAPAPVHTLLRSGLATRKTVRPHAGEHETLRLAEGGRA